MGQLRPQEKLGEFPEVAPKVRNIGSDTETQTPGTLELEGFSEVPGLALAARKLGVEKLVTLSDYFLILGFDGLGSL